jgi:hypothetical protein
MKSPQFGWPNSLLGDESQQRSWNDCLQNTTYTCSNIGTRYRITARSAPAS